jgi:carbamoyl-phosphate synthase small subunit
MQKTATLRLKDKTNLEGLSFGADTSAAGEVVFSTGMMGYPESLTDPSYKGQILVLTYPLIGNYGVPEKELWEADRLMIAGLIVSEYIDTPSHFQSKRTLAQWCIDENVPLLQIKDTRALTQKIREEGALLGKIVIDNDISWYDPNHENLVAQVSTQEVMIQEPATKKRKKTIVLIDCGAKRNIQRALLERGYRVMTIPWNMDPLSLTQSFNGILISNGPGDPKMVQETIKNVQHLLTKNIPILGICLGHQILCLAAGGDTKKLPYGHRSQNQPCIMDGTKRCYITTQNHGFAVSTIPDGFKPWFTNANDNSNEGIIHNTKPIMSVQFHPEATPGPMDAE